LGGDGVAGAVVFGEGFDLVEVVGEVDGAALEVFYVAAALAGTSLMQNTSG